MNSHFLFRSYCVCVCLLSVLYMILSHTGMLKYSYAQCKSTKSNRNVVANFELQCSVWLRYNAVNGVQCTTCVSKWRHIQTRRQFPCFLPDSLNGDSVRDSHISNIVFESTWDFLFAINVSCYMLSNMVWYSTHPHISIYNMKLKLLMYSCFIDYYSSHSNNT